MDPSSTKTNSSRLQSYKNHGKGADESRRQRQQYTVSLRKKKRDEHLEAKRNLRANESMSEGEGNDDDQDANRNFNLDDLFKRASSDDPTIRFEAIRAARKLLSIDRNPPIDQLIQCQFLPILVQCLKLDQYPDLQFEAAWALTNIASGNSHQTQAVADADAVPHLLRLLSSNHGNVCEQAVWALGNLIGDGPRLRDYAVDLGVIRPLVEFIHKDVPITFLRNVTWVIVNLCRHKEPPLALTAVQEILPALNYLISYTDITILVDCTWALAYLLDCGNSMIQVIVDAQVIPKIVLLLNHNDIKIVTAALRAVGNVVTGTDEQTQLVLNCGALNYFPKLFQHQRDKLNKEAVWFLSNITAGNQQQVQAVINANLIPAVIYHLTNSEIQTQKEAAWCISNLTMSGNVDQIQYVVDQRILRALCQILSSEDLQLLQVCLDAIHNILKQTAPHKLESVRTEIEECRGLDKIESLQNHSNRDIHQQSYEIIERFFSEDDEEEDLSDMNSTPTMFNGIRDFDFAANTSGNQTVPDSTQSNSNSNENPIRFQF